MRILLLTICLGMILATPVTATLLQPPVDYAATDTLFPIPTGGYVGGFDIAANGNFIVFNGGDIQEITPSGTILRTIQSVGVGTSGSFVKLQGDLIYYGESTNGTVCAVRMDGTEHRVIATLPNNYDAAFNGLGQAFVVTGSEYGAPASANIYQLDLVTGAADLIASIDGPSGPIIFDESGSLYYGTVSSIFGARGGQSILSWTAEQIAGALGPGSLSATQALEVASDVDSPAGFAWGPSQDLYFTSVVASPGNIWRLSSQSASVFASADPGIGISWLTTLRYDSSMDSLSALVGWMDESWNTYSGISTLSPLTVPVPEPGSLVVLGSLLGWTMIRRRKSRQGISHNKVLL